MDLKSLKIELGRLQSLVEPWQTVDDITPIERDLALARLREVYAALAFGLEAAPAEPSPVEVVAPVVAAAAAEPATVERTEAEPLAPSVAEEPVEEAEEPESPAEEPESPAEEPESPREEEPIAPLDAAAFISLDALLADLPTEQETPGEEEVAPEPEATPEPETAPEPEAAPAPATAEVTPSPAEPLKAAEQTTPAKEPSEPAKPATHNLFGEEEVTVRHRHKQRVIMSLYDTVPEPVKSREPQIKIETLLPPESEVIVVEAEPEVIEVSEEELLQPSVVKVAAPAVGEPQAEEVAAEPVPAVVAEAAAHPVQPTLGESLPHVQTLADKLAADREAVEVRREPITDLRRAVSFNDKFLLIQELFNGNGSLYEITIRRLNEFDNFDDCMIYIAENFAWNPNSDGAKLMMDLLERKFQQ